MAERPVLTKLLGPPREEILADFIADIPAEGDVKTKTQPHAFSVWRSLGLAQWDRQVAGRLSESTQRSLHDMLRRLPDDGFYRTVNKVEIPYTTTNFELTVQAARAIAAAPGWIEGLTDDELKGRVQRMRTALAAHQPRHDYERALQLQLAVAMPELVAQQTRDAAISVLWKHQQADGGWSTRSFSEATNWGPNIRPDVIAMLQAEPDAAQPTSDAYMTAFAMILLRENAVPTDDPRIQRGVGWLKANQRESGRWWMKSLYKDTQHFSTYIATAHALRALALCGEIPEGKIPVR
jgi:squalene-hopene/tetraprenyl-beta-curcumene cyclase